MDTTISEVVESASAPVKKGTRWLVTIARPGKGMTGTYPEDTLKESGPKAFPAGTKAFFKHANPEDRDVRDMVGIYKDGAFWNEEEGELQAYLYPFPRYESVLDEAKDAIEASIHARARKDSRTGVVQELIFDRANSVDLVAYAGIEGSGLKYQVESLFAQAAADSEDNGKGKKSMDEKQFMTAIEGLTSALATLSAKFDTFVAESKAEVKGEADAAAVAEAVKVQVKESLSTYAATAKSIDEADIPAKVKESLKEKALEGEDVSESLNAAVEIVAEAKKDFTPQRGVSGNVVVVAESATGQKPNLAVAGWSRR